MSPYDFSCTFLTHTCVYLYIRVSKWQLWPARFSWVHRWFQPNLWVRLTVGMVTFSTQFIAMGVHFLSHRGQVKPVAPIVWIMAIMAKRHFYYHSYTLAMKPSVKSVSWGLNKNLTAPGMICWQHSQCRFSCVRKPFLPPSCVCDRRMRWGQRSRAASRGRRPPGWWEHCCHRSFSWEAHRKGGTAVAGASYRRAVESAFDWKSCRNARKQQNLTIWFI